MPRHIKPITPILLSSASALGAAVILALAYHIELWPFELLISFAKLATWLLIGALVILAISSVMSGAVRNRTAVLLLFAASLLAVYSFMFARTVQPDAAFKRKPAIPDITFVTFNREYINNNLAPASKYIKQQHSDIIALQETTPEVTKKLSEMIGLKYTYDASARNMVQGTGAAIISKYPITETETFTLGGQSSLVRTVVTVPDAGTMAFYSLHLMGPFTQDHYNNRKLGNQLLTRLLAKEKLPLILGGDFNTTIFSPGLQKFNKATQGALQSTTGRQPACSRYSGLSILCLRIDHVYIPRSAELVSISVSPELGSDHRALVVRAAIR